MPRSIKQGHLQPVTIIQNDNMPPIPVIILAGEVDATVSVPVGMNGGPVAVGTEPVKLTFAGVTKIISIKSASTNTGLIWFGPSSIDNTGANACGELTPDSAVEIELNDAVAPIYVVSDTAAQKVYKAAVT